MASWVSRRPRAEVASWVASATPAPFQGTLEPCIDSSGHEFAGLGCVACIAVSPEVLRSTIHKLVIAVNRQLMVMAAEPEKAASFEQASRTILADLLDPLEQELYALCDAVEALPALKPCDDSTLHLESSLHA